MKKTLLAFSVLLTVVCCALAFASSKGRVLQKDVKLDRGSVTHALAKVPEAISGVKHKVTLRATETGGNMVTIDLLDDADEIYMFNDGAQYDSSTKTFLFPGLSSDGNTEWIFTGVNDGSTYAWYPEEGRTYSFKGHLSSTGKADVYPCIVYLNTSDSMLYIASNVSVSLDESNGFSQDFEVNASGLPTEYPLYIAFIVSESSSDTMISSSNSSFGYSYVSLPAQAWSPETDLPGLGLTEDQGSQAYTVMCEDGVTTLGLFYDGAVRVTGINTTASDVTLPEYVTIDGAVLPLEYFGMAGYYGIPVDWSGASSLRSLHMEDIVEVSADFTESAITDIYVSGDCYLGISGNNDIYLHIPYGAYRGNYEGIGFKRVLVGDETPDYPQTSVSSWVIAGENEGEYFGISIVNNSYYITEVFTAADSVILPFATPGLNGLYYYIYGFGADQYYGGGTLCKNAPNLRSVTIPERYRYVGAYWTYSPIEELHMLCGVPETYYNLNSDMTVYVAEEGYYSDYENDSYWNGAKLIPEGWEFEWLTVNVGRKGEFAQTYIEMTDADWSRGIYVKVTGSLNSTDLVNMKNLTNLRALDLSEASFDVLPNDFMSNNNTLTEMVLPESLTSISSNAFSYCRNLTNVVAPGVRNIGSNAFNYCQNLTGFDISNVVSIDRRAFAYASKFNPSAFSPELQTLGDGAFNSTAIENVILPEGITTIESSLFNQCEQLKSVVLPSSIRTIGNSAFYYCNSLQEINLPEGITSIGTNAFSHCVSLTELTIPSTVENIGYGMFDECSALQTIKCKAIVPPVANGDFTNRMDLNHTTLYVAPFVLDVYRATQYWSAFYIMKPLEEPVKNIYINRPMTFDLLSEDNAVLQENPNMTLDYGYVSNYGNSVGQLTASGDGTLSAGVFKILHSFQSRSNGYSDYRTTLVNHAENMRADSVVCSINFEKNRWHFISFQYDVRMEDIYGLYGTDFVIRSYNSANRAMGDGTTSNWETVPSDGVLHAGTGYIIQTANNSTDANGSTQPAIVRFPSRNTVTKNRLFTGGNVIVPLEEYPAEFAHNRSWNLVGNPYPCYYDMHALKDDFTTPIVLWRGTSYQAYSPVDDDIILRPNEAFFVQRPIDVEQMTFGSEGRMHYAEAYSAGTTPGIFTAPSLDSRQEGRSVFNFNISGCGNDDRTRIVMNESALMEYEVNRDAPKFFAEVSAGAEIYVDGAVKFDICERPLENGTAALGMRVACEGEYTISLAGRNTEGWIVILTDTETGISTDLTECPYVFNAKTGTTTGRFVLTFMAPGESSVSGAAIDTSDQSVRVVNTNGILVFEGNVNDFKASAQPGVYVVVSKEKASTIVVK